jgi:hypothetical protein
VEGLSKGCGSTEGGTLQGLISRERFHGRHFDPERSEGEKSPAVERVSKRRPTVNLLDAFFDGVRRSANSDMDRFMRCLDYARHDDPVFEGFLRGFVAFQEISPDATVGAEISCMYLRAS